MMVLLLIVGWFWFVSRTFRCYRLWECRLQSWQKFWLCLGWHWERRFRGSEVPRLWRPVTLAALRAGVLPPVEVRDAVAEILTEERKILADAQAVVWRYVTRCGLGWVLLLALHGWGDISPLILLVGCGGSAIALACFHHWVMRRPSADLEKLPVEWSLLLLDDPRDSECRKIWRQQLRQGTCLRRSRSTWRILQGEHQRRQWRATLQLVEDFQPLVELVTVGLPVIAGLAVSVWPQVSQALAALY